MEEIRELIKQHKQKNWNKIKKSDEDILKYLNPYTNKLGIILESPIIIEQNFGHISVKIDIKSAFNNSTDSNRIKKYLKRNGFEYNYNMEFLRATNNQKTNIDDYNAQKYLTLTTP